MTDYTPYSTQEIASARRKARRVVSATLAVILIAFVGIIAGIWLGWRLIVASVLVLLAATVVTGAVNAASVEMGAELVKRADDE